MTQNLATHHDDYAARHAALGDAPDWLRSLRSRGFEKFSRLGFPTARRGNEAWKYTNVAPIARARFSVPDAADSAPDADAVRAAVPWSDDWITLAFVNGRFSPELSSDLRETDGATVSSLPSAIDGDGESAALVRRRLGGLARADDDGFAALNAALVADGAVVSVPPRARIERPVHLAFISDGEGDFAAHPRVLVVAGEESEAAVIESYVGLGENAYLNNGVAEILVEEGARLDHYRLMDESDSAYHVGVARVRQMDGSAFASRAFYRGVGLGRHDLYALIGDGCETKLDGLYVTAGSQHVDNFINIDHAKPNSTSALYYKGILSGRSRAVFGGTVFVREGAVKTDATQSDKNLLLSPEAEVDSKPALFIWADDVKCGHGATAGNIDAETVFYMRSRGVDLETASRMLIFGFASEVIDAVEIPELRARLERSFLDAVPRYEFEF